MFKLRSHLGTHAHLSGVLNWCTVLANQHALGVMFQFVDSASGKKFLLTLAVTPLTPPRKIESLFRALIS